MKYRIILKPFFLMLLFCSATKVSAFNYLGSGAKIIAAGSGLLLTAGAMYQYINTKNDERDYPPLGKLVDIGGYRLHINCTGNSENGKPTVVLEAGLGGSSLDWSLVQPEVAKFSRVCSYDRGGHGWSDESPHPRTSKYIVQELHELLLQTGEVGPFVLVGHSFGGINVRLFANAYPEQVAGIVLVDSSHEDQNSQLRESPSQSFSLQNFVLGRPRLAHFSALLGLPRLILRNQNRPELPSDYLLEIKKMELAKQSTTKFIKALSLEKASFDESLMQLKKVAVTYVEEPELGDKPLKVITAGKNIFCDGMSDDMKKWRGEMDIAWRNLQENLATKSSNSKQVIAKESGHLIPRDQPQIIVDEIKELLISLNEM